MGRAGEGPSAKESRSVGAQPRHSRARGNPGIPNHLSQRERSRKARVREKRPPAVSSHPLRPSPRTRGNPGIPNHLSQRERSRKARVREKRPPAVSSHPLRPSPRTRGIQASPTPSPIGGGLRREDLLSPPPSWGRAGERAVCEGGPGRGGAAPSFPRTRESRHPPTPSPAGRGGWGRNVRLPSPLAPSVIPANAGNQEPPPDPCPGPLPDLPRLAEPVGAGRRPQGNRGSHRWNTTGCPCRSMCAARQANRGSMYSGLSVTRIPGAIPAGPTASG